MTGKQSVAIYAIAWTASVLAGVGTILAFDRPNSTTVAFAAMAIQLATLTAVTLSLAYIIEHRNDRSALLSRSRVRGG